MFVYLFLAIELALVYGAFWYLFLRNPRFSRKISASAWGSYHGKVITVGGDGPTSGASHARSASSVTGETISLSFAGFGPHELDLSEECDCCGQVRSGASTRVVRPFMLPVNPELIFDPRNRQFKPVLPSPRGQVQAWLESLDDFFSWLNVRP